MLRTEKSRMLVGLLVLALALTAGCATTNQVASSNTDEVRSMMKKETSRQNGWVNNRVGVDKSPRTTTVFCNAGNCTKTK